MLPKSELKYIQSLGQKKLRAEYGQFVAEGPKVVGELLARKPGWLKKIYGTAGWWNTQPEYIKQKFQSYFIEVETFELEKISNLQTPQDVLAVSGIPKYELPPSGIKPVTENWILVLDGVQDPGNMGTILRTAHWFGIQQVYCSHDCADVFQPKVVQASMGSIFSVEVHQEMLYDFFSENKLPVYGALLKGKPVDSLQNPPQGIILIGNEGKGIRADLLEFIDHPVTIPGIGDAESLNAAIAAGILLYSFTKKG